MRVGFNYILPAVSAETGTIYGYAASALQTGITISGGEISGTLKYVTSGDLADYWGAGNFIALKVAADSAADATLVGFIPSEGSGLLPLDEDRNLAGKVTDKDKQLFACVSVKGAKKHYQLFEMDELTCNKE